jgi:hypothetical protein
VPENLTLLPLPPRFRELNPVGNVWQFRSGGGLSNCVFNGYDDIVAHCCAARNELIEQTLGASAPSAVAPGRTGSDQCEVGSAIADRWKLAYRALRHP